MTDKETPMVAILFFKMRPKIFRQDFVMTNIPCEFEISTFALEGHQKSLLKVKKTPMAATILIQNEAKNIPRQDFMVMNISCKFEKASYNIFFVRVVMLKSLYTLRQRCNKAKSIVSTECSPVDAYSNLIYLYPISSKVIL